MGFRVLKKIEQIVREEQDRIGQEMLMPTIQPADLWRESGRYDAYGPEMLRIRDLHERDMLYGPTNEEQITQIFRDSVKSYRDLPKMLYHIQWKFRDEVRPRFGVMRGREFLMKDAYSFDLDFKSARHAYNQQFIAYLRTFQRMDLKAIPMQAESGPIGGDMSHEFVILADTGESEIACHKDYLSMDWEAAGIDYASDLQPMIEGFTAKYAATDEKRDAKKEKELGPDLITGRAIEVGHIFYFGTKYSKAMKATVVGPDGAEAFVEMGSYGIGVSRLVGAIIEASHDDAGIVWPEPVTPFLAGIVNLKVGDGACDKACDDIYSKLEAKGMETLLDDRDARAGAKFADMDLIGLPWQVVVGPRGLEKGVVELKNRKSGERQEI
ncbi:MAG: proline--tRNA ligase, partial [Rhodospirillales bacterium RIFCSPLOWO2_01_FULL_65_14]